MADRPGSAADAAIGSVEGALVADRARLVGLAYRITGSRLDAEDIVQEAWERARRVEADAIDRPAAWLTTVVSRLALDHLRAAQRRRETYVGPWLPEPVLTGQGTTGSPGPAGGDDPSDIAELAESLTFGFLRLLESLSPVERVVFVLADVFGVPFPQIARSVDRSPDACRQIAARARSRVRDDGRRDFAPAEAEQVADALVGALTRGEVDRIVDLLAPDVVLVSDGGPSTHAARRPVVGPERVARLMTNLVRRGVAAGVRIEQAGLNGGVGFVALLGDVPITATAIDVAGGMITRVHSVANPEKLAALGLRGPLA